jgi:hypothetical protein
LKWTRSFSQAVSSPILTSFTTAHLELIVGKLPESSSESRSCCLKPQVLAVNSREQDPKWPDGGSYGGIGSNSEDRIIIRAYATRNTAVGTSCISPSRLGIRGRFMQSRIEQCVSSIEVIAELY